MLTLLDAAAKVMQDEMIKKYQISKNINRFPYYTTNLYCKMLKQVQNIYLYSAAASGWAGLALAHPEFGSSVNPITNRGADYAQRITASPPGFENPAASQHLSLLLQKKVFCTSKQCDEPEPEFSSSSRVM